jgi:dTMP kinase
VTRGGGGAHAAAPGILITFEGIEGSGKSTQLARLAGRLTSRGHAVEVVREPGGTALGEALRSILLSYEEEAIEPRAELLLYLASRAQLVARVVRPALQAGRIVLADRFGDASVAYQGGGRALGIRRVGSLVRFATRGLRPARTYLIDLPVETSLARVRSRGSLDRLEREQIAFHAAVRGAYLEIARSEPERVRVIRGTDAIEKIEERIASDLARFLASVSRVSRSRRRE